MFLREFPIKLLSYVNSVLVYLGIKMTKAVKCERHFTIAAFKQQASLSHSSGGWEV